MKQSWRSTSVTMEDSKKSKPRSKIGLVVKSNVHVLSFLRHKLFRRSCPLFNTKNHTSVCKADHTLFHFSIGGTNRRWFMSSGIFCASFSNCLKGTRLGVNNSPRNFSDARVFNIRRKLYTWNTLLKHSFRVVINQNKINCQFLYKWTRRKRCLNL